MRIVMRIFGKAEESGIPYTTESNLARKVCISVRKNENAAHSYISVKFDDLRLLCIPGCNFDGGWVSESAVHAGRFISSQDIGTRKDVIPLLQRVQR